MTIHVVGMGWDGEAGLSESVREVIEQATVLVGSDRDLSYFSDHPASLISLQDLTAALTEIQQYLLAVETHTPEIHPVIVVLISGDSLFFGLGGLFLAQFPAEILTFHPHLSSIQLAFNRLQIPFQDVEVMSSPDHSLNQFTQALQQNTKKIAILTDSIDYTPNAIARLLSSLNLSTAYQIWTCENLGRTEERVQQGSIEALSTQEFSPLTVVILLRESQFSQHLDLSQIPFLGIPDQLFCRFENFPELITPREIRTLILGELALQPEQMIWDIGAGTGSVSIEIARLFPSCTVYAVEKTAVGTALIEQNRERFQTQNVISVHGEAPAILHRLRAPHRIFIGVSEGNLEEILGLCSLRLISGGVMVLALTTLEHLNLSLNWLKQRLKVEPTWRYQLLQVQLSCAVPVKNLTGFYPLDPVTILTIHHLK